jgi:hypothetical protein
MEPWCVDDAEYQSGDVLGEWRPSPKHAELAAEIAVTLGPYRVRVREFIVE